MFNVCVSLSHLKFKIRHHSGHNRMLKEKTSTIENLRTKAFSQLKTLALEFIEPSEALLAMRVNLEKVIAHAKATCTKNLIDKYLKNGIAFNDAEAIAKGAVKGLKCA